MPRLARSLTHPMATVAAMVSACNHNPTVKMIEQRKMMSNVFVYIRVRFDVFNGMIWMHRSDFS